MALIAYGINHRCAPVQIREQLAVSGQESPGLLKELVASDAVNEAMVLSTCNRTEFYIEGKDGISLLNNLNKQTGYDQQLFQQYGYCFRNQDAVSHVMRVACGIDSMVLGEPQIVGQMKQAFELANEAGSIGSYLGRMFQTVFTVSKQIRTHTDIGRNPISLASAVLDLAKQIFSDLTRKKVLLIGGGETIELVAQRCLTAGIRRFVIANRTEAKVDHIISRVGGHFIQLSDIPVYLRDVDIVVSATASPLPILGKGTIESALKMRRHRPIFMVDLAVPRDIEGEIADLEDIYLYNIDDLQDIIEKNTHSRQQAVGHAQSIIELQSGHFMREIELLSEASTIRAFRREFESQRDKAYAQVIGQLKQGVDPEQVVKEYGRLLCNKIMNFPTKKIREAAYDQRKTFLSVVRQLFNL